LEETAQNAQHGGSSNAVEDGELAAELRKLYKGRNTTVELKVPPTSVSLIGSSQEGEEGEEQEKDAELDGEYLDTARRVRRKVTLEEDGVEVMGGASTAVSVDGGRAEVSGEAG
jgi:uncharacterized protein (DUF169 family)